MLCGGGGVIVVDGRKTDDGKGQIKCVKNINRSTVQMSVTINHQKIAQSGHTGGVGGDHCGAAVVVVVQLNVLSTVVCGKNK